MWKLNAAHAAVLFRTHTPDASCAFSTHIPAFAGNHECTHKDREGVKVSRLTVHLMFFCIEKPSGAFHFSGWAPEASWVTGAKTAHCKLRLKDLDIGIYQ